MDVRYAQACLLNFYIFNRDDDQNLQEFSNVWENISLACGINLMNDNYFFSNIQTILLMQFGRNEQEEVQCNIQERDITVFF